MKKRKRERRDWVEIVFWNVAGLYNKDKEFWEYIREFDVVSLSETWVEEKGKKGLLEILPKEFKWEVIPAERVNRKGRAKGGFVIGIKGSLIKGKNLEIKEINKGLIRTDIESKRDKMRIWSVYNSGEIEKIIEEIDKEEVNEERLTIVGGDFNVRIGEKGRFISAATEEECRRRSKDKILGNHSDRLIEWVENKG